MRLFCLCTLGGGPRHVRGEATTGHRKEGCKYPGGQRAAEAGRDAGGASLCPAAAATTRHAARARARHQARARRPGRALRRGQQQLLERPRLALGRSVSIRNERSARGRARSGANDGRRACRRGRAGARQRGEPAPPAAVRLRPRALAVPLAQLPGAAAGTRARHAGLRAPRGGALQAGRRLPAAQRVAGAARRLPRLRALRAAALRARPPPRRRPVRCRQKRRGRVRRALLVRGGPRLLRGRAGRAAAVARVARLRGAAGRVRRRRAGRRQLAARLQLALRRRLRGRRAGPRLRRLPAGRVGRPRAAVGRRQPVRHGRGGGPAGRGFLQGLPVFRHANDARAARARAARHLHPLRLQEERDGQQAAGRRVHQLPHVHDVAVAAQRAGRERVQRLRPVLQAAQHQPAAGHEEGLHPDAEAQAQERGAEAGARAEALARRGRQAGGAPGRRALRRRPRLLRAARRRAAPLRRRAPGAAHRGVAGQLRGRPPAALGASPRRPRAGPPRESHSGRRTRLRRDRALSKE